MSGGFYEVMASFIDQNLGSSGFESDPTLIYGTKYFDKYPSTMAYNTFNKRILGDATGELGAFYTKNGIIRNNWWNDYAGLPTTINPWVDRGGMYDHGTLAGQLYFSPNPGEADEFITTRIVLVN